MNLRVVRMFSPCHHMNQSTGAVHLFHRCSRAPQSCVHRDRLAVVVYIRVSLRDCLHNPTRSSYPNSVGPSVVVSKKIETNASAKTFHDCDIALQLRQATCVDRKTLPKGSVFSCVCCSSFTLSYTILPGSVVVPSPYKRCVRWILGASIAVL